MRIRAKTFKHWLKANFTRSELNDIAMHGANAVWRGLIYYCETARLYARYKVELWEYLIEESESLGYNNPFEFLATFKGAKAVHNITTMEHLLVWYAAESISHQISNRMN